MLNIDCSDLLKLSGVLIKVVTSLSTPDLSFVMDWALSVFWMKLDERKILLVYQDIIETAQYHSKHTHFLFNRLMEAASASLSENSNSSPAGSSS